MTAEKVEASDEVVAGNILVYSILILSLFYSGASHFFLSSTFTTLHAMPLICMNNHWEISTKNEVITTNRICKYYVVELSGRKLEADLLILDSGGYEVIIGMILLSKYHTVIDYRNKKVIFRIPNQPEFQFLGEKKTIWSKKQVDCDIIKDDMKRVLVWKEFPNAFEGFKGLPPDRV